MPDVDVMLEAAARAKAAGAEVVVASLHCCVEYENDPTAAQVPPSGRCWPRRTSTWSSATTRTSCSRSSVAGEWVAYGLGNQIAEHSTRGYPTEDSVMARFTFTRGTTAGFTVTRAEAVPLRIEIGTDAVRVVPADPKSFQRIAGVLDRRGAVAAGLDIRPGLTRAAH